MVCRMKINDLKDHLLYYISKKIQQVPYITGPPGIGKSYMIKSIANELNYNLIDLRLSQCVPEDIKGIPWKEENYTVWLPPDYIIKTLKAKCILFLDELDKAKISVQNAALELILERKAGNQLIGNDTYIIAAGNCSEELSFSNKISDALNNRMIHFEIIEDLDEWINWANNNNIDSRIISYIKSAGIKSLYGRYDGTNRAWPTPRSWEFASNAIRSISDEKMIESILSSSVGSIESKYFLSFINFRNSIKAEDIIKGTSNKIDLSIVDYSVKNMLLSKVIEYITNDPEILNASKNRNNFVFFISKFLNDIDILAPALKKLFIHNNIDIINKKLLKDKKCKETWMTIIERVRHELTFSINEKNN